MTASLHALADGMWTALGEGAGAGGPSHALASSVFMVALVTLVTALLDDRALSIMLGLRGSEPSKRVVVPRGLVLCNYAAGMTLARATLAVERALSAEAEGSVAAADDDASWLSPAKGALTVALVAQFATSTFLGIEFAVVHTLLRADAQGGGRLWSLCVLTICAMYMVVVTLVAVRLDTSLLNLVLSSEWLLVLASPLLQAAVLSPFDRVSSSSSSETKAKEASETESGSAADAGSSALVRLMLAVLAAVTAAAGAGAGIGRGAAPSHFRDLDLGSLGTHSLPAGAFFVALTGALLFAIAQGFAFLHVDYTTFKEATALSQEKRKQRAKEEEKENKPVPVLVAPGFEGTAEDAALYWSPRHRFVEAGKLFMGSAILALAGPFVVCQVVACTVWEFVDKKTINLIGLCRKLIEVTDSMTGKATRHPQDGFIAVLLVWLGACLPAWFFYELYLVASTGALDWRRLAVYNLVRIGPMYMHFMHVYVLCHKEGHLNGNLLCEPLKNSVPGLKYAFNHWVGMFHGVVPGTFTYSHVYNHHRYDNDQDDVYSTAFRPRDEFLSWVRYLPEWFAYACNLSTLVFFHKHGKTAFFNRTLLSTAYYLAFLAAVAWVSPLFCLCTLVYAFVEGNVLLSVVNFTWHAFIDVNDPSNDYVNSTTIIEGLNFTGKEEYHVVHHQYAGAHRLQHEALYLKHEPEYRKARASIFYKCNIFEVFGLCVAQQYDQLADRYYYKDDKDIGMTKQQIADMLKTRLKAHGPLLASKVGRQHK